MTQTAEIIEHADPEGSIFLAYSKGRHIKQFLALEGDPVEHVAEVLAGDNPKQVLDRLQFSLLQSRGVERIDEGEEMTDEALQEEVEKRALFYGAVTQGIELLASEQAI